MSAFARTFAVTLAGLKGHVVTVEAHSATGLPGFTLVGLPDASVRESRERVRAALQTCGLTWGEWRITVNLSPADLPKSGSGFDVSVAVAILAARGVIRRRALASLDHTLFLGELGLDAAVHPVRGILPCVQAAAQAGITTVVVPYESAREAALIPGVEVLPIGHLADLITMFGGGVPERALELARRRAEEVPSAPGAPKPTLPLPDLADVVGQHEARTALEVAAAGGHHLLFVGPPGAGKTMMASRLPGILPPLETEEALEVTALHSIAGTLDAESGLLRQAPWRAPHHTATRAALIGGGNGVPRPGEVSLAHRGVLFLDEAPEFPSSVLDVLRQPLEQGTVTIDRARGRATYPAQFQLLLAANPCPCGNGHGQGLTCTCTSIQRRRYFSRLSGPLLDRVDLQVEVAAVSSSDLVSSHISESSAAVAERVLLARQAMQQWLAPTPWSLTARVPGQWLRHEDRGLDANARSALMNALDSGSLSLRGVDRVLRIAWTLAFLGGKDRPGLLEVGHALHLRQRGQHS